MTSYTTARQTHPPSTTTEVRSLADRGQGTAEYALLLLGAATIALIVLTWATGTGKISELFDAVVESIIARV